MAFRGNSLLRSLLGVKRTSLIALHMSAYDPKRTWANRGFDVAQSNLVYANIRNCVNPSTNYLSIARMVSAHTLPAWQKLGDAMIELIIFIVVAFIAWVVWTERKSKQALDKDLLDQAWREVLDDPHYMERRHYEERKRVEDQARAAAANR